MQLKKIRAGVVYAQHGTTEYDRERGHPVIVLDTQMWELTNEVRSRRYRRTPGEKPVRGRGMFSHTRGIPVLALPGAGVDTTDEDLAAFTAAAERASARLAKHADRDYLDTATLVGETGDLVVSFHLINPREVQVEWAEYADLHAEAEAARLARYDTEEQERKAAIEARDAAIERIRAVLPNNQRLAISATYMPDEVKLSWTELAELLDAYADARQAATRA